MKHRKLILKCITSKIASWTAVRVLDLERGPFCPDDRFIDGGKIVLCATIITCFPLQRNKSKLIG